jgi:uncharacterized protein (DUF362 family)
MELGEARYPPPPFHPGIRYPEYLQPGLAAAPNPVYDAVRELFRMLGLDAARYATPQWNPLSAYIHPGNTVLIKPNLVRHYHAYGMDPLSLVTNGSLVRAVCDYALKAAGPQGKVIIADAPLQSCDFDSVLSLSGLDLLAGYYRQAGIAVEIRDLRLVRAVVDRSSVYGRVLVQQENPGDPLGYTAIDMGGASLHADRGVDPGRYRVTCYDPARMARHHGQGRHEYVIANTLLAADAVLNLPKMKTHHKAGITGALKNFIGINGHKDCLPHHVQGPAARDGDEYASPNLVKSLDSRLMDFKDAATGLLAVKAAAATHRLLHAVHMRETGNGFWEGSWYGNDTISRTTVDLNRIVRFAGKSGRLAASPQRPVFTIVDGIVSGDQDGPLAPTPRPDGILLAGDDPVAVDQVMARLMGFQWRSIPTLRHAAAPHAFPLGATEGASCSIETVSNQPHWRQLHPGVAGHHLGFRPHKGWKGHIEL